MSNVFSYNGGSAVAMTGKNCVVIAGDFRYIFMTRFYITRRRHSLAVSAKVCRQSQWRRRKSLSSTTKWRWAFVDSAPTARQCELDGFVGEKTVIHTLCSVERMRYRGNMYQLNENRHMRPAVAASVLSNMLYGRRGGPYFVSPIVAGINEKGEPEVYRCEALSFEKQ